MENKFIKHNSRMPGFLKLFMGCMYAGKTTKLIEIYNDYKKQGIEPCVINYYGDVRYHNELLSSHDKVMIPCLKVKHIYDAFKDDEQLLERTEVFIINEGQFFADLYDVVRLLVTKHNKKVYVCGLDGDFKMGEFGEIIKLIPLCDEYEKLFAKCNKCGGKASFTKRLSDDKEQTVIGGSDMYIPVCRNCYILGTSD